MLPRLALVGCLAIAISTIIFCVVGIGRRRHSWAPYVWSCSLLPVVWWVVAQQPAVRTYMVAAMVTAWCLQYIVGVRRRRAWQQQSKYVSYALASWGVASEGHQRRRLFLWYGLPALVAMVLAVPVVLNAGMALPKLRVWFTVGYTLWAFGFYIVYRAESELSGKKAARPFDDGLWRYSRHPDYFGQILQWLGIALVAAQTSFGWAGLVAPFIVWHLITAELIPRDEKPLADDKAFQDYAARTRRLWLWVPKTK